MNAFPFHFIAEEVTGRPYGAGDSATDRQSPSENNLNLNRIWKKKSTE